MRALVTGHTGFIGSNLLPVLRKKGFEVVGYATSEENDILDSKALLNATRGADIVYHLASLPRPTESLKDPAPSFKVNLVGTMNVLEACKKHNFVLVYASSCDVYGDSKNPITEETPLNPTSPYAAHKAAADRLCYAYARSYKLDTAILRIFNPYGPQLQMDKVIPTFYRQARAGMPITVYGTGSDVRDHTYVSDVAEALSVADRLPSGEAVNICTGKGTTNLRIAEMVKQATGSTSEIVFRDYPEYFGGYKTQVGVNKKAVSLLDWRPTVDLEDGLRRMIDWLDSLKEDGALGRRRQERK